MNRRIIQNQEDRKGAMLVLVAFLMIILIVGAVFSVDIAYMHMVRAELRTATDAAARAGAEALARTQDENLAIDAALAAAELNIVGGQPLLLNRSDIQLGSVVSGPNGKLVFQDGVPPLGSVRVVGERVAGSRSGPVNLFFGAMLGQSNFQPVQVATASASVRDIALVLDRSGSMQAVENGLSRIDALKIAVDSFIDEVETSSPNSNMSLTTYSTNSTRDIALTPTFDQIRIAVGNLPAAGFTNIFRALRDGSNSLQQDANARPFAAKTIVLMTDGNFNVGGTPIPSAQRAADRGHTIHTITFSSGANQAIMQQVAAIGGGQHFHADDAQELDAAFREIARSLSVVLVE
jgi:Mg-chelatase subunit ChlD